MANQTVTVDSNILTVTAGLNDGQNITVNSGAVLTFNVSPDKLIGQSTINDGEYFLDGANATNPIIFCGESNEEINVNGLGIIRSSLGWWEFPTLGTGLASQTFDSTAYFSGDPNNNITADVFSGVWVETGRRITYDAGSGVAPVVHDWCFKTDGTLLGRITEVSGDGVTGFIVLEFMFGALLDNDAIELHTLQDNQGTDYQKSWNALVNNASGDVLETGTFSRWGNLTQNNVSGLATVFDGFEGMGFDQAYASNTLTFGDGTNGLVVPNGARVRIPMVHFCTSSTAQYALGNTIMAGETELTRHNVETNLGGEVRLHGASIGSAFFNDSNASAWDCSYIAFNVGFGCQNCGSKVIMNNIIGVGDLTATNRTTTRYPLNTVDLINGCQIDDITMMWMHSGGGENSLAGGFTSFDINYKRVIQCGESNDLEFNKVKGGSLHDIVLIGNSMTFVTGTNIDVSLIKNQQRFNGANTRTATMFNISTFSDVLEFKGMETLNNSGVDNSNFTINDATNVKIRGFHFIDDPYVKTSPEEEFIVIGGVASGIDVARCYTTGGNPNEFCRTATTNRNITLTDCSGDYLGEFQPTGTNVAWKGVSSGAGAMGGSTGVETDHISTFGSNVNHIFRSDTTGAVVFIFCPPSTENPFTEIVGSPQFTKDGDFNVVLSDSFVIETYEIFGMDSFTGVITSSRLTGTVADGTDEWGSGNVDIEFQHDTGAGYNGTWLDARVSANLTAITGMVDGIKLKVRITGLATRTDMNGLMFHTTTSIALRKANPTPIDQVENTLTLTGLEVGSDVVILDVGTNTVLSSVDQTAGTTFSYTYQALDAFDIGIIKSGFVTQYIYGFNPSAVDSSLPIIQRIDRNYK